MTLYVRRARLGHQIDPMHDNHEFVFSYRFVLTPREDADAIFERLNVEVEQVLRRAFPMDIEFKQAASFPSGDFWGRFE